MNIFQNDTVPYKQTWKKITWKRQTEPKIQVLRKLKMLAVISTGHANWLCVPDN